MFKTDLTELVKFAKFAIASVFKLFICLNPKRSEEESETQNISPYTVLSNDAFKLNNDLHFIRL